jgi:hypothetical protein
MPTIANKSQKNPIRKATWTSKGAAFFKLRRIIYSITVSYQAYPNTSMFKNIPRSRWSTLGDVESGDS